MNKQFNIQVVRNATGLGPLSAVGVATREVIDYAGDIVEVSGMQSRNADVVMLANHDPSKPIGRAKLSVQGYEVKAYMTFAPEGTTETADEYRKLCKAGVLTDLSIGFNPLERKPIEGGGWRFTKWLCMEVSLVSVGCNPEAVIIQRSQKAGRVLSGSNAAKLQQAHDAAENCRSLVADVLGGAEDSESGSDKAARARRSRDLDLLSMSAPTGPQTRSERMAELRAIELRVLSEGYS